MQTIGNIGIQLVLVVIYFAIILVPAFLVDKINDHYKSEKRPEGLGCLTQIVIFLSFAGVLTMLFYPAKQALVEQSCRYSQDFDSCINGDNYSELEYDRR